MGTKVVLKNVMSGINDHKRFWLRAILGTACLALTGLLALSLGLSLQQPFDSLFLYAYYALNALNFSAGVFAVYLRPIHDKRLKQTTYKLDLAHCFVPILISAIAVVLSPYSMNLVISPIQLTALAYFLSGIVVGFAVLYFAKTIRRKFGSTKID